MEHGTAGTDARTRWLDALLDMDTTARGVALAAVDIPGEWRQTGARLCALTEAEGILDRDPGVIADRVLGAGSRPSSLVAGAAIGRYRLEKMIGEGGMATVWLARHQDERLPQRVAVKCLRTTLSTPEWRERFLREQRILARLTHPNVTRLYDAGIVDDGTPYIVMEHVGGEPITVYCDEHGLSVRDRVRLFRTVCNAVAHAHQRLIVHRDLKPRNVLVGDDGQPHLLDFGIAKLLDPTDVDADMTRTGLALLTPAYAAPEQFARGTITTATDVYGLGAMLHELLTGARARHHGDGRLYLPSARVDDGAGGVRGGLSTSGLRRLLRGDLDAILECALRREPELRYASASELGEDLQRWLAGSPVLARTGSWRYRADKFVRRHWFVLSLVAFAVIGLSATTAISMQQSARADRAAQAALREAGRAQAVRDFMVALMEGMRPDGALASPEALIDHATELARERLPDPETQLEVLIAVGELDRSYGRLAQSEQLLEEAAGQARQLHGSASDSWLEAEASLGQTLFRQSRYEHGERRLAAALHAFEAAGGRPGPARVRALMQLGKLRQPIADKSDSALALHREAYEYVRNELPPEHPLLPAVLETYGYTVLQTADYDLARKLLRENLALRRDSIGGRDLEFVSALEALAVIENDAGNPAAAVPLAEEGRALATDLLKGRPHVMAAYVENTLGNAHLRLGEPLRAQAAYERALAIFEELYDPPHQMLIATHTNLAEAAFEQGRHAAAAAHYAEVARQRALRDEPDAGPRCQVAEVQARDASSRAGIAGLQRCIDDLRDDAKTGYRDEYLGGAMGALAEAQWRAGDAVGAARTARAALGTAARGHAHARVQPLLVLALATEDAAMATQHGIAALAALEDGTIVRPCDTRRMLGALAERLADLHDGDTAARLRQRVDLIGCTLPETAAISARGPGPAIVPL